MKREFDPEDPLEPGYTRWTDYDGDQPYGDFAVVDGALVNERSWELGLAMVSPWASAGGANTQYYHTDMIGTTRLMTNPSGNGVGAVVYTAFGERVTGGSHYCGYAGAWGYEKEDLPFLHVGHRYYDPAIGRFLQRDPIGIRGGSNVYGYVRSAPTLSTDPSGLIDRSPPHWQDGWQDNPHWPEAEKEANKELAEIGVGVIVCWWAGGIKGAAAGLFLYWWWA